MARKTAEACSVFTIEGTTLIGELMDVTISVSLGDEDASAINEVDDDPVPVSRSTTITGSCFVDVSATLVAKALTADPVVTFVVTTGGNSYSGTGLLSTASHEVKRKSLQKQSFTIKSKGAVVGVAPTT